jgi:hypothetical protein
MGDGGRRRRASMASTAAQKSIQSPRGIVKMAASAVVRRTTALFQ